MSGQVEMPRPETTGADYFDLHATLGALAEGRAVSFPPMEVVRAQVEGRDVTFCCNMQRDPIQKRHRQGRFYEGADLEEVAAELPEGARILDVGANVGNHALYFALFAGAARVVVVEPNPLAMAPLVANVLLNGVEEVVDLSALGVGLSDRSEGGYGMRRHTANLGATKMRPGEGRIEAHAGDDLFGEEEFDLIKIDVEGMEMKVLAGLERTISRDRPQLVVEVDDAHAGVFEAWVEAHDYAVRRRMEPQGANRNYWIFPRPLASG